ncbi:hypothetical protein EVAR_59725_1 [Eumeta japonica]|uniref:Uncharacterized protein n=1 Tax=Eumeta variegata TaxID=151549 RepID=A0A4C1XGZ5_EUMVA|nr:hypothetical protein EVAR_59725_1 [Eumeta japonica]
MMTAFFTRRCPCRALCTLADPICADKASVLRRGLHFGPFSVSADEVVSFGTTIRTGDVYCYFLLLHKKPSKQLQRTDHSVAGQSGKKLTTLYKKAIRTGNTSVHAKGALFHARFCALQLVGTY